MELAAIVIHTWYVGSEVVLGVGLGPVDGGPGVAAAERGEQHVGLELPQRERVGRVEELAKQERAEQGPVRNTALAAASAPAPYRNPRMCS